MRVAVCLSGLVRTYRDTYTNFIDNLLTPNHNHQIDVFISTWTTEHSNKSMERTRRLAWYGDQAPPFPENDIDYHDLQKKYKPVTMAVEAPRIFPTPHWYKETPGLNLHSVMCMIYKIYAADVLRRQHEFVSDVVYDRVIRHRFDTLIPIPINLDDLHPDKIYVPSMMQPRWDPNLDWTNDKFAAGSSVAMSIYSNWFNCLEDIVTKRAMPIQPEIMLANHLAHNHLQIQELGTEFEMVRIPGF